eukprot:1157245-Pelagomonas_calceolata.AAC.6
MSLDPASVAQRRQKLNEVIGDIISLGGPHLLHAPEAQSLCLLYTVIFVQEAYFSVLSSFVASGQSQITLLAKLRKELNISSEQHKPWVEELRKGWVVCWHGCQACTNALWGAGWYGRGWARLRGRCLCNFRARVAHMHAAGVHALVGVQLTAKAQLVCNNIVH